MTFFLQGSVMGVSSVKTFTPFKVGNEPVQQYLIKEGDKGNGE